MKLPHRLVYFVTVVLLLFAFAVMYRYTTTTNLHYAAESRDSHGFHPEMPDFRVLVMTYNRAKSLTRLLESLNAAEYYGDRVCIDIFIDIPKTSNIVHAETYVGASNFRFKHGSVMVHNHTTHHGILGQWMFNWKITDKTKEIIVFFEDDITVSKYFYKWLKLVHRKYDHLGYINGYSLQGKTVKFGGEPGLLHGPDSEVVFAFPVIGCWGFSPHNENWYHFITWYQKASRDPKFQPLVPEIPVVNSWYKRYIVTGATQTMWEIWHIHHANKNHKRTLYVNFPNLAGMTINWEEPGLHYSNRSSHWQKPPLVKVWDPKYENLPEVPVELDLNGKVVKAAIRKTCSTCIFKTIV